jgi:uncharacterized SAM-binding protein YcdF (DUF218 family)
MNNDVPSRRAVRRTRAGVALLTVAAAVAVALPLWNEHTSIFRSAAQLWAVSDTLAPADAVVVLAGGSTRPRAAVQLYRSGLAARILLDDDNDRNLVLSLHVPPRAVEMFGIGLHNTRGEACAMVDWIKKNGAHRIIVPTESFPSRRVKWVFGRELESAGAEVTIDVLQIPGYTADDWWSAKGGRDNFLTEIIKYVYYRLRYSFDKCKGA